MLLQWTTCVRPVHPTCTIHSYALLTMEYHKDKVERERTLRLNHPLSMLLQWTTCVRPVHPTCTIHSYALLTMEYMHIRHLNEMSFVYDSVNFHRNEKTVCMHGFQRRTAVSKQTKSIYRPKGTFD